MAKQLGRVVGMLALLAIEVFVVGSGSTASASTPPRLVASPQAVGIQGDIIPPDNCTIVSTPSFKATCHVDAEQSQPLQRRLELVCAVHLGTDHGHARERHDRAGKVREGDRRDQRLRGHMAFGATSTSGYVGLQTGAAVVYLCG